MSRSIACRTADSGVPTAEIEVPRAKFQTTQNCQDGLKWCQEEFADLFDVTQDHFLEEVTIERNSPQHLKLLYL